MSYRYTHTHINTPTSGKFESELLSNQSSVSSSSWPTVGGCDINLEQQNGQSNKHDLAGISEMYVHTHQLLNLVVSQIESF